MLLAGKKAVVAAVTNRFSLGWGIARALHEAGAEVLITYQGERTERSVTKLAAELPGCRTAELDVQVEGQIEALMQTVQREMGGLDVLVHAMAFAPTEALSGSYVDTSRDAFTTALQVSCYSLTALAQAAEPLMTARGGGSIMTLTYLGGERVIPHYNVMGVAKAALEASVKYLASDLGRKNIRVNAISSGPVSTASSRAIGGYLAMEHHVVAASPLGRRMELSDIGGAAVFLASDLASGITGENIHVDGGYHAMGTTLRPDEE